LSGCVPVEISAGIGGLRCAYPALQIVPLNSLKEGKDSAVYSANFSERPVSSIGRKGVGKTTRCVPLASR